MSKKKDAGPKLTVRISDETSKRIKRLKVQGFNISSVVRQILEDGLEKFEKGRK